MTLVAEADAYSTGAGVELKVTPVAATVVPTFPDAGIVPAARGDGPMVNPLTTTTSPGATEPEIWLAPVFRLKTWLGGATAPNSPGVLTSPFEMPAAK